MIFGLNNMLMSSLVCLPPPPASSKTWHHPLRGGGNPLSLYQLAKRRFKAPSSASGRTFRSDPLTPTISNLYTLSTLSSLLLTEEEIYKYSKNVIKWPKNRKKGGVNTVNTVNTGFFPKVSKFPRILPVNIRWHCWLCWHFKGLLFGSVDSNDSIFIDMPPYTACQINA